MSRPYIVCHMVESIDGRIDCGIDGREGWRAMFDGIADQSKLPTKLRLQSVERLDNDVIWIKYNLEK